MGDGLVGAVVLSVSRVEESPNPNNPGLVFGKKWTECIDKGWLRELKEKEKEIGNVLE